MTTTVDTFLGRLKRRITMPENQALLTTGQILEMADDVTRERIVPAIMSVNQNYFVVPYEETLEAEVAVYDIPYRSIGRGLRDLKLRNGTSDTDTVSNLALIALEDAHQFGGPGVPSGFYFRGDKVVLVPAPISAAYKLLGWYNLQPSSYVQVSDACLVSSISDDTVTCSSVPSTFIAGTEIDFVQGKSGCSILSMDVSITGVSGSQVTFATDAVPDDLVAGDYIALKQQTPVLQIPDEAVPLLEAWTGERILYAVGDFEGAQILANRAEEIKRNCLDVLSPRVEGEPTKIVNRNGLLRGKGFNSWNNRRLGYYP